MSQYEIAIEEYNKEDDDGRYKLVYAYFGLAVYYSQSLEETYSIMLWINRIFKDKVSSVDEINEIIDSIEYSRKTMGNFVNEIQKNYQLPEQLKVELLDILNNRNYIVHRYFKENIQSVYSEIGRKEIICYFCNFIDKVQIVDEELNKHYNAYIQKVGITEKKLQEMLDMMISEERKRDEN